MPLVHTLQSMPKHGAITQPGTLAVSSAVYNDIGNKRVLTRQVAAAISQASLAPQVTSIGYAYALYVVETTLQTWLCSTQRSVKHNSQQC